MQHLQNKFTAVDLYSIRDHISVCRGPQSVILVVTPVHKSAQCKEQGRHPLVISPLTLHYITLVTSGGRMHMCEPRGLYCISRQLLCDGRVNCVGEAGDNTGQKQQSSQAQIFKYILLVG